MSNNSDLFGRPLNMDLDGKIDNCQTLPPERRGGGPGWVRPLQCADLYILVLLWRLLFPPT